MSSERQVVTIGTESEDKAPYVRRMFSAIAGRYDLLNSLLSFSRDGAWRRFAASRAQIPPGGLALDVATGTGELARHLARGNDRGTIVGVDFCPAMLARARAKLAMSSGGERVQLALGDALRLPFRDNTFDCVTIGFALRNVADVGATFREMARVLKPGGRVVSLELTWPSSSLPRAAYRFYLFGIAPYIGGLISGKREAYRYLPDSIVRFFSPREVKRIMEGAGLHRVEIHRLTLGAAIVHTGRKGAN